MYVHTSRSFEIPISRSHTCPWGNYRDGKFVPWAWAILGLVQRAKSHTLIIFQAQLLHCAMRVLAPPHCRWGYPLESNRLPRHCFNFPPCHSHLISSLTITSQNPPTYISPVPRDCEPQLKMASSDSLDQSCQSSLAPVPNTKASNQGSDPSHSTVHPMSRSDSIFFANREVIPIEPPANCSRSVVLLSTGDVAFPGIRPCLFPFFSPSWVKSLYIVLQLDMVLPMKQFVAKPTGFRSHEKAREQCSNKLHTHNMKNRWPGKKKKVHHRTL